MELYGWLRPPDPPPVTYVLKINQSKSIYYLHLELLSEKNLFPMDKKKIPIILILWLTLNKYWAEISSILILFVNNLSKKEEELMYLNIGTNVLYI